MSKQKTYTPGPWRRHGELILSDATDTEVAEVKLKGERHKAADATLIAAAPDLLEALEKARDFVQFYTDRYACPNTEEFLKGLDKLLGKARGAK